MAVSGWSRALGGSGVASPSSAGDVVYAVSGGSLFAFDSLGNELWSYNCGSTGSSSPSVAPDGTIYVASTDSNLYAVNPDGTLKWKKSIQGFIRRLADHRFGWHRICGFQHG